MRTCSALRSGRLPVNLIGSPINYANRLIGSPINYANRLIGSPINSQSTADVNLLKVPLEGPNENWVFLRLKALNLKPEALNLKTLHRCSGRESAEGPRGGTR